MTPLIGTFLADALVGCFWTIAAASLVYQLRGVDIQLQHAQQTPLQRHAAAEALRQPNTLATRHRRTVQSWGSTRAHPSTTPKYKTVTSTHSPFIILNCSETAAPWVDALVADDADGEDLSVGVTGRVTVAMHEEGESG
uniref:Uncharacterized protein n=1 Tax=Oryza brachyantha TaxID=4533 RepID=J3L0Y5_ORYBR